MNISIIVNTNSGYQDLWPMFFDSLKKYCASISKIYVCVDPVDYEFPENVEVLNYDSSHTYTDQFLSCIKKVKTEYCIYITEDYILYDDVKIKKIQKLLELLDSNRDINFIKLLKGPEPLTFPFANCDNLYWLDNKNPNFFTHQATIWRTSDLAKIYENAPKMGIAGKGGDLETFLHITCRSLEIHGLVYYEGEKLRGTAHHDSNIFPYIATALIKGKWNLLEYENELMLLLNEYGIDFKKRGNYV